MLATLKSVCVHGIRARAARHWAGVSDIFSATLLDIVSVRLHGFGYRVPSAYLAFKEAWDASCVAARIAEEIEGRCGTPDRPEFIDGVDCGNRIAVPEMGTGAVIDVSARNVEDLRRQISNELSLPDAYTCKRVKQIESTLEKIEAFHTERERRRDAAGLHQAEAAYEEAYERACITADAALALEPTSLRDLAMQAEVAMKGGRDGDEGDVLKRLISFAGLDNRADPLARSSLARSPVAC